MSEPEQPRIEAADFAREAEKKDVGILRNFWDLLKHTKKWWLVPIVATLLVLGLLILFSGTAAAPFIYALF